MARQWDTHKEFAPNYRGIARLVFMGWLIAMGEPNWRRIMASFWSALSELLFGVFGVVIGVALLVTAPASFPLLCLANRWSMRRKRLAYIRRNRKADADI